MKGLKKIEDHQHWPEKKKYKRVGYMCSITRKHVQASHFSFKILNRFYNIDSFRHEKLYGFLCQSHVVDFWHTSICVVVFMDCLWNFILETKLPTAWNWDQIFLFWYDFLSCLSCVAALGWLSSIQYLIEVPQAVLLPFCTDIWNNS